MLHAKHVSIDENLHEKVVIVKFQDFDVFLLTAAFVHQLSCLMFFATGVGNHARVLHVNRILEKYGQNVCSALLGFHAFTGCDSTSSFKGKGKTKPFNLMIKSKVFSDLFAHFGEDWTLSEEQANCLEAFVCSLYNQSTTSSVNKAIANIFKETMKIDSTMPPNKECLHLHCLRSLYQTALWRQSLTPVILAPSPVDFGWTANTDSSLTTK